ncbi:MAG: hypothetical protein IKD77_05325 [Bacilli bacterium]|nr:hypothetical protein [Bacilli bacterium]
MDYKVFKSKSELPLKKRVTMVYSVDDDKDTFIISEFQRLGGIYTEEFFHVGECNERILKTLDSKEIWVEAKVEKAFLTVYDDALIYKSADGNPLIIKELKLMRKNKS